MDKVLYFSTTRFNGESANEIHVVKLSAALKDKCQLITFGLSEKSEVYGIFERYGITKSFDMKLFTFSNRMFLYYIWVFFQLIINSGRVLTRNVIIGFFSCFLLKDTTVELHYIPIDGSLQSKILFFISRLKKVKIICITHSLKNDYVKIYRPRNRSICVIPDAADLPSTSKKKLRSNKKIAGYVGSFNKGKGVELIIELADLMPTVEFHLVGGTTMQIGELKNNFNIGSNVFFYGRVAPKLISSYINSFDVCILPNSEKVYTNSDFEEKLNIGKYTSPLKLFEYMAHKKLILCSKLPVLQEIVSDKNVVFFEPDSIDSMKCSLDDALNNPVYQNFPNIAFEVFIGNYTWSSRADNVLDVINVS